MRWPTLILVGLTIAASCEQASALVFGSPVPLNSNAATDNGTDVTPELVTDRAGTWVAAWTGPLVGTDVLYARSTDNGATWSPVSSINPAFTSGGGGAHLATDGTTWVAVWIGKDPFGDTDDDVFAATSTDGGATWSLPVVLNTNAATDGSNDQEVAVATDGAGTWVAVWRSDDSLGGTIGTDFDILFARSLDGGATWTPPAPLNGNAAADAAPDTDPQLATDGAGTWVAVWEGAVGGDADILVARSTDGGATWSAPAALNGNAASDSGDDYFPHLAFGGGTWLAVWTSIDSLGDTIGVDEDILVARSADGGVTWTPPAPLNGDAATDAGDDTEAAVSSDGLGTWVAVWYGNTLGAGAATDDDIFMAQSTDGGISWSYPLPLTDNAARDGLFESDPQIATDGAGTWLAVWDTQDDADGLIGADFDIVAARGTEVACSPAPAPGCGGSATAPKGLLQLTDGTPDKKDSMVWKWISGQTTDVGDFGDPPSGDALSGSNYRFCVYDGASQLILGAVAAAGGRCGAQPCWKPVGNDGFQYRDRERTPQGIAEIKLRAGQIGKGKITVKANGAFLAMPALGSLVLPLQVQLQAGSTECWAATFSAPAAADSAKFKARSD